MIFHILLKSILIMVLNEYNDNQSQLLLCIWNDNNDEAKAILQNSDSSDVIEDSLRNTLLHFSSKCGNTVMTEYFIERGYNVNAVNSHGNTPLLLALQKDHNNIVRMLLKANAIVLISNNHGLSAVKFFCHEKEVNEVLLNLFFQKLKQECANDSLKMAEELHNAHCTLARAVILKDTEITEYLLDNGYDINHPDPGYFGCTALHVAVRESDEENVNLLISRGADMNVEDDCGRVPLFFVGRKVILEIFLSNGAQLVTDDGTLTTCCPFKWGKETIDILKNYNLDFSAKEKDFGNTILHELLLDENFKCIELLEEKINDTFDINDTNNQGLTPLMLAAVASNIDAVEFLLKRGADVNIEDRIGNTALCYALVGFKNKTEKKIRIRIIMLLLQHGLNIQCINTFELTFFDHALFFKTFDLAKIFIAHLVLMEVLGYKIKKLILNRIDSHVMFKNHYNLCKKRIERMKQTMICEHISLFKLFVAGESEIVCFAQNKILISKLQAMMNYKHGFKLYYYQILRNNIVKIVKQASALQQAVISIVS